MAGEAKRGFTSISLPPLSHLLPLLLPLLFLSSIRLPLSYYLSTNINIYIYAHYISHGSGPFEPKSQLDCIRSSLFLSLL